MTSTADTVFKGTPTVPTILLARAFGRIVQEELTPDEFSEVVRRNRAEPDGSGICHTHDFVDANMLMLEAWQEIVGDDPAFLRNPDNAEGQYSLLAWNEAWSLASASSFSA